MKTKDDLIEKYSIGCASGQAEFEFKNLYQLMDEYSQQMAIAFLKWADMSAVRAGEDQWTIGSGAITKYYTTQELYTQFLNSLSTK